MNPRPPCVLVIQGLHFLNDSIANISENNIKNVKTHRKPIEIVERRPFWYV